MRVPAAALALVAVLLVASVALAKERPQASTAADAVTRSACRPQQALVLRGTFIAGGPESFQMDVRHASRRAHALRGARELRFDAHTRLRRNGAAAAFASLQPSDRLHVLVRGCKRAGAAGMELLARKVTAHAVRSA